MTTNKRATRPRLPTRPDPSRLLEVSGFSGWVSEECLHRIVHQTKRAVDREALAVCYHQQNMERGRVARVDLFRTFNLNRLI